MTDGSEVIINKNVLEKDNYKMQLFYYHKAREGFHDLLKKLKSHKDFTILLPSFIGYSPNEGSGIDDPIEDLEIKSVFYKMDENLNIDVDDLKKLVQGTSGEKVLLLVHYYGCVDKNLEEIVKFARDNNIIIIEDCAHAYYTDFVDMKCGHYGDYSIYSLHKMFPFEYGGMLKINNNIYNDTFCSTESFDMSSYNIASIAGKRKSNARIIKEKLKNVKGIKLFKDIENVTLQTFPILVDEKYKEELYFKLNGLGYQVVALYFRMIPQIDKEKFAVSYSISQKILNLPVHQDVNEADLIKMCDEIILFMENCYE